VRDRRLRPRIGEVLAPRLHPDDRDAVGLSQSGLRERLAARDLWGTRAGDREAVVELDVVRHGAGHQVGDPLAHVGLGAYDVGGADAFEDRCVLAADGLGPDLRDSEVRQAQDRQDAGLDVGADADDRTPELLGTDLPQGLGVRAVGGDDVGEVAGELLHDVGALVDGQDLVPEAYERLGDGRAEAPQADDQDRSSRGFCALSQ